MRELLRSELMEEQRKNKILSKDYYELQKRINKAIEYIEDFNSNTMDEIPDKLIWILEGKEDYINENI